MKKNNRNMRQETYRQELNFFNYKTKDNELIKEFEKFMKQNMTELTGEIQHQSSNITVTDLDMRSVVNAGGRDRAYLISLTNSLTMTSKQKNPSFKRKHEMDILTTIVNESKTFRKMMNGIKKYMDKLLEEDFKWNIVSYRDFLAGVRHGR